MKQSENVYGEKKYPDLQEVCDPMSTAFGALQWACLRPFDHHMIHVVRPMLFYPQLAARGVVYLRRDRRRHLSDGPNI